ncbi:hypothetical protein [Deinococcus arcticus]|uniref:Uncharacterized protein n=1 Tax=Deinococcus arcticus TaxID=2136176 RepID=A0A2T3W9S5_9DEIO|nr:hypothetical protein [Deinococcus arcticus]PTA68646.1 hypothetical protein C8263_05170 [Deinococcus arcticus]
MSSMPGPLTEYLDAVTAPFPADTAARLRAELGGHALAAAEALADQGHPDPLGAALADLGWVREVRRALERQHYTQAEDETLLACRFWRRAEPSSPVSLGLGVATLLGAPLALLWLERPVAWGVYGALCALILTVAVLERWLPRRFPARSARVLRALVRLGFVPAVLIGFQALSLSGQDTLWAVLLGTGVGFWLTARREWQTLWPLRRKALAGAR